MFNNTARNILEHIEKSPTAFHVVKNIAAELEKNGFSELSEKEKWNIEAGKSYYVIRNGSAIISFKIPKADFDGFYMLAGHSDSPTFKLKENPEMESCGAYVKLNVEKYGGMLIAPWFDRTLSVAGRVIVRTEKGVETKLVSLDRDICMLPSLAIHMDRNANSGHEFNVQSEILPIVGDITAKGRLSELVAEAAGVKSEDILSSDLYLYNRVKYTSWGISSEYISSARLDDQMCVYASLEGFLEATPKNNVAMHCVFDNEEVGSGTRQGAASTFLKDTLERINDSLGRSREDYHTAVANSFMISADNAHAVHPNRTDVADPVNQPKMNEGIVIKYNANQRYTTDAVSAAVMKSICEKAEVPYQTFVNNSNLPGGSTLGNISTAQVPVVTVDIGLAQLAMHSPYETAGAKDAEYLARASKVFFESDKLI